jgi:methionine-gamma-lyase
LKTNHVETNTIHAGKFKDIQFGSLTTPLYQTSTFIFDSAETGGKRFSGDESGYIYGRLGNPTVRELEEKIACLENTEDAAATGSGMAAISATVLGFINSGEHIISSDALYGCTRSFLEHQCKKFGISVTFVDMRNAENLVNALQKNTKLVYFETPINPNMVVLDIEMIVRFAKEHNLKSICDNTFLTPILQKPAEFGVDLIVHSATKYLNGHGDVLAGLICGSAEDIAHIKQTTLKDIGGIISPHDAWLIIRGMKTLVLRIEKHCENAKKVADFLQSHELVQSVYYPGLETHPQYLLVNRQMKAAGGVLAFELDGNYEDSMLFMNSLKLCTIAVSLGDAETLIQHPASMTHSPYEAEDRRAVGISDTLIRLSVGLEHIDDIIEDLEQALTILKTRIKKELV